MSHFPVLNHLADCHEIWH